MSKTRGKKVPKGKEPSNKAIKTFLLQGKTYFLTYTGISVSGQKITKFDLANYLTKHNPNDRRINPEKYLVCEETYESGEPHFHVILVYSARKQIKSPDHYDYLGVHPNIQVMRNMKAALDYVYKQDLKPVTNMDLVQEKLVARASHNSSIYELLYEQMVKDPFNFDPVAYCLDHNIHKQVYKTNYTKAIKFLKLIQQAYCNKLLFQKPGFKTITRSIIQSILLPSELIIFDSWSGFQTIVDHLNQIPTYRFRRPAKTKNLLITGPKSVGKSALVWQTYPQPNFNPLNSHCSVYPMGMKDWFPDYRSQVYDIIYWNEAKLTSYSYDIILQLLDGSPVMLPAKGSGHKKVDNPLVIMTSNMTLDQMVKEKFGHNKVYQSMANENLSVRVTNVVIPAGYDLFLIQKLLVPVD